MYKDVLEYSISWLLLNHMAGRTLQSKPLLKYFTQSVIYKHTKLSRLQRVIEPLILFFSSYPGPFTRFVCDSTNSFRGDLKHKITLIRNNMQRAAIICNISLKYIQNSHKRTNDYVTGLDVSQILIVKTSRRFQSTYGLYRFIQ